MQELLTDFAIHLKSIDSSDHTVRSYVNDLKSFVKWYVETTGADPVVTEIGPLDIAEFKRYLLTKGRKPATINRAIVCLSRFFLWLVNQGLVKDNPAKNVKRVPENKSAPKSLERKEIMRLMRAVQGSGKTRDLAIVTLLLHTGVRVSELCNLEIEDIVLKERSGSLTVRSGKGNKWREVPLNSTVRRALSTWLAERGPGPGRLFTGRKGGKITERNVEYLITKYAYEARLEKVTPHTLRHCFCKNLIDAGVSLDRVALLAGHSNLNTTARYTMAGVMDLQRAVQELEWE